MRILSEAGFKVVGHAGDWAGVNNILVNLNSVIVLVDVGLAGYSSDAIKKLEHKAIVVVLTPPDTPEQAAMAIKAGAKGYLSVNQTAQDFIQALRIIARGDIIISREAVETLKRSVSIKTPALPQNILTDRETEVLCLLGSGLTNYEIGERLFVSEHTVKVHLRNVLTKLNLRNRQQAAAYAAQRGMIRPEKRDEDDF